MRRIVPTAMVGPALIVCVSFCTQVCAADLWAGNYTARVDSYRWEAAITKRSDSVYNFRISVSSKMPACSGDFSGPAKLMGGKLVIKDEDCSLSVSKQGANSIHVEEGQCNAHGAACVFDSTLKRKG